MYEKQMAKFDQFVCNIFSSITQKFQGFIPVAISLYSPQPPTHIFEILIPWLSESAQVGPKLGIPKFLYRQRIFNPIFFQYLSARLHTHLPSQFHLTEEHYANFALVCAQLISGKTLYVFSSTVLCCSITN
jgi:hypothetical protein